MRLSEVAIKLGYSKDYFHIMRSHNKDKYDFILSFDNSASNSVKKCIDYIIKLSKQMEVILYEYDNKKNKYGKLLQEKKISNCKSVYGTYQTDDVVVFRIRAEDKDFLAIPLPTIKKWEKVVELLGDEGAINVWIIKHIR